MIEASAKAYLNAVNRHLNSRLRKKPARKKPRANLTGCHNERSGESSGLKCGVL